ncbi:MAG: hypothetical protein JWO13_2931 [Acidobacteriales bacterium]|nr:hypothetical protein [Terriglobales bacterium]
MRIAVSFRVASLLLVLCLSNSFTFADDKTPIAKDKKPAEVAKSPEPHKSSAAPTRIMPLEEVKLGMRGVAYTVFEGTKPEAMEVEILGVLHNMNGPKSDMILARLHGTKVEFTGVVAGMSGSPVYIDGKLIGALAFRIGSFSKEPIAGITPIEDMLEINELDRSAPPQSVFAPTRPETETSRTSISGGNPDAKAGDLTQLASYMTPIAAPLVFSGFSDEAVKRFMPQFVSAGIMPVLGAGSVSNAVQPEAIEPGSSVGIVLVRGDMDIAATCTVTYMDAERLLACGHPLFQFGKVEMPMTKSTVLATLPSPLNAFKIAASTETIGSFVQDRHTGIMGKFGADSQMIPVTLNVRGGSKPKQFHYEMLNNPKLTPVVMMSTIFNALQGLNEYGEDSSYRMEGKISVQGFPTVQMQNMFAPADAQPTSVSVAMSVGDRFGRIYENSYQTPDIKGVQIDLDLIRERRWARIEAARTDMTEARPGDQIMVEVVLRPFRGERIVKQIPVRIPTTTPKGNVRILISDGDTLDKSRRSPGQFARKLDLNATIASLNKERTNDRLYVSVLQSNPQAMVEDKVMPGLPLSVMNVMDGMRGTQDMIVSGESAVDESSTPLDFVVAGSQVITLTIK